MTLRRKAVTAVNVALMGTHQLVSTFLKPAQRSVSSHPIPRLEAVWLPAIAQLSTVHVPKPRLRRSCELFDVHSFLNLLGRCRKRGPLTQKIVDTGLPDPAAAVEVNCDYYSHSTRDLSLPYAMHPKVYAHGWHRNLAKLRSKERRIRIFFAGSVGDVYNRISSFPLLTRNVVIDYVLQTFRDETLLVTDKSSLDAIEKTDKPIVVVLNRLLNESSQVVLDLGKYMQLVGSSSFALCPPGQTIPHAHNIVEAIALGTIPITNYHQFCRPHLETGRNCLGFNTLEELNISVRRALEMSESEIARLRNAAVKHYEEELTPTAFARRLQSAIAVKGGQIQVSVVNEHWTPRLYETNNQKG